MRGTAIAFTAIRIHKFRTNLSFFSPISSTVRMCTFQFIIGCGSGSNGRAGERLVGVRHFYREAVDGYTAIRSFQLPLILYASEQMESNMAYEHWYSSL